MIKANTISKVGFIGSGRVATQMAIGLYEKGINIVQIYSRTYNNALSLAEKTEASAIESIKDFNKSIDIIIISISDNAFLELDLSSINEETLVVHTSGSLGMDLLSERKKYGVFYPLQTFNFFDKPLWNKIPFCVEANSPINLQKLKSLAMILSNNVYEINSKERSVLHLSAVFVCNFTNSMYAIGEEILDESGISLDILRPLIEETAKKVMTNSPKKLQTGPAVRNDEKIIEKHISSLNKTPDYADIYKLMTKIISKQQKTI